MSDAITATTTQVIAPVVDVPATTITITTTNYVVQTIPPQAIAEIKQDLRFAQATVAMMAFTLSFIIGAQLFEWFRAKRRSGRPRSENTA